MHIILTHEQADFDALASLLGAYLTNTAAVPLLPRKLNRNVRAFITLYGMELPFVDPRDLPGEEINAVTLVDTQSMISVKGMVDHPQVRVIDHHPVKEELPADWIITSEETGATATIFTEALRERDSHLSTIEATLLLLGIYEDTGSLTYTRTSARDLTAASFLLERGASLEIAGDFLNHPLSKEQQALYDRLRSHSDSLTIHGHTVIIACGDASDMDEELSTVAHKLRDLLDPEALFVLITTRGGIQLIARSTNEDIDVAQISDHFGGGGHERAAAALIKERDLESVCQELKETLPAYINPAVTVSQVMSSDPQLLFPDTPVHEVAIRMQRFGYEGYPVVEQDSQGHHQIRGLLTRRAVDRAIAHKLNLNAASLMDAGQVSVNPGDSIEYLQQVMTDTGWGQVPVVDPKSKQVVGIVTRTDLLNTLTRDQELPHRKNLTNRLDSVLPEARLILLKAVAQAAHDQHAALYIVGGFVRDLLLDRPSQDFDLVVEGDAIQLARSLANKFGGRVTSHSRFGTSKWHIEGVRSNLPGKLFASLSPDYEPDQIDDTIQSAQADDLPLYLDLITARREFYTYPSALPIVERGSIKLDLHRRDFTINTLALRLDGHHYGELHDYWGGFSDLQLGLVRVLHSLSFVDDPTRMLRAVRFEQRFAFKIEDRTLELIAEAIPLLERVSGDRIRHELDHILDEEQAAKMLSRLNELDLLTSIQEDLTWDDWLNEKIVCLADFSPEPAWGLEVEGKDLRSRLGYILCTIRLSRNQVKKVIRRLKLQRTQAEELLSAQHLRDVIETLADAKVSKIVSELDTIQPLAIYANYISTSDNKQRTILCDYASTWSQVEPHTDGHQLRSRGIPPGPVYREILKSLRNAWLDGKIASAEQEEMLLEELISQVEP